MCSISGTVLEIWSWLTCWFCPLTATLRVETDVKASQALWYAIKVCVPALRPLMLSIRTRLLVVELDVVP